MEPEFSFKTEIHLNNTKLTGHKFKDNKYSVEADDSVIKKECTKKDNNNNLICEIDFKFFNISYINQNDEIISLGYTFKVPVDHSKAKTINIETTPPKLKASSNNTKMSKQGISAME